MAGREIMSLISQASLSSFLPSWVSESHFLETNGCPSQAAKSSWHTWAQPSVVFLFLHSLNNYRELQAILNALCNSQDILLFFLLLHLFLWAVICSQVAKLLVIPSLLIAPLVFLNCSPCSSFLFAGMCPVW